MSKTMKAASFPKAGAPLEVVQLPIPEPKAGEVRIKVKACGVCHSDLGVQGGQMGNKFPRVPGHEVAGVIDTVGEGVKKFKAGDKVGVGWQGGFCGECATCEQNQQISCPNGQVCGLSYDGGYAEYMVCPENAVARLPEGISFEHAAPLLCAGITVFNGMRQQRLIPGDVCAIIGVGGLGHLAVQFANKMGLKVVAVSSGADKEKYAKDLGAHVYINSKESNVAKELQKLGGAKLIVATAPHAKSIEDVIDGLDVLGKLLLVAIVEDGPLKIDSMTLISKRRSIVGWACGDYRDSEDTLEFSVLHKVEAAIETFPLDKAVEAFDHMKSGKVRFRAVLTM